MYIVRALEGHENEVNQGKDYRSVQPHNTQSIKALKAL